MIRQAIEDEIESMEKISNTYKLEEQRLQDSL